MCSKCIVDCHMHALTKEEFNLYMKTACADKYINIKGLYIDEMLDPYNFEEFMLDIYKTDLLEFGKDLLVRYAVFVGAYGVLTYVIYSYRYGKARKSLRIYYQNLKKVSAMNRKEE